MPQLDNYLVSLGMKGQNVVLSTMKKIRDAGKELNKKITISMTPAASPGAPTPSADPARQRQASEKFVKAAERFTGGVQNFANAASSLDPVAVVSSMTSALGTSLSGISVLGVSLGRLPEGIAAISNSMLTMAQNSVNMARQATATYHQLVTRNAAAQYYGERVTDQGPLSRNERAMFIDAVSGSMGRIGQPLAAEINRLIGQKDTRALARVGAGDWESTGTDRGWMLGQVSSSFAGLPPSVRQRLQASLLRNFSSEIQDTAPGQAGAQRNAAAWANMEENQTARLAARAPDALKMAQKMNDMQVSLYNVGIGFSAAIGRAVTAMESLPATITSMQRAMNAFVNDPNMRNLRTLMSTLSIGGR